MADIIGAHKAGLQGILVKTGKQSNICNKMYASEGNRACISIGAYVKGDERHLDGRESTFLAENFAHAAEIILKAKKH